MCSSDLQPDPVRGRSFSGPARDERPLFSETRRKNLLSAVREGDYKLIHDEARESYELFDLGQDPAELEDLFRRQPEVVQRLTRKLDRWQKQRDENAVESSSRKLSQDEIDRLEQLGYLGGEEDEGEDESPADREPRRR